MCNLYSIATNQEEAICALFCMIDCYVGNLPPMPGVFLGLLGRRTRNDDDALVGAPGTRGGVALRVNILTA